MQMIFKLTTTSAFALICGLAQAQCQNVPINEINECFQRQQLQRDVGRMVQDVNRQNAFPNSPWVNQPQTQRQCVRDVWGNIQCN